MLDEIIVALAALRLHEAGCTPALAAATLAAYSLGGFAGALAAERAQAAAYELAPGRPGLVQALAQAFVVLEALMPLALGALASCFGLSAALAALALQPLVMLLVALSPRSAP